MRSRKLPPAAPRQQRIEQRGACIAEMQFAGGARRETGDDRTLRTSVHYIPMHVRTAVILFVSDLHLDAHCAARQWRSSSTSSTAMPATAPALYILGDLFETWIGDDDDEAARTRVCAALRELTARGMPCCVVRGNRDFLLGAGFRTTQRLPLLPDPVLLQVGSTARRASPMATCCARPITPTSSSAALSRDSRMADATTCACRWRTRRALARRGAVGQPGAHTRRMRSSIMDVDAGSRGRALPRGGCDAADPRPHAPARRAPHAGRRTRSARASCWATGTTRAAAWRCTPTAAMNC